MSLQGQQAASQYQGYVQGQQAAQQQQGQVSTAQAPVGMGNMGMMPAMMAPRPTYNQPRGQFAQFTQPPLTPGNPIKHEGQGRGALCRLKGISAGTAGTFNARRNGAVHKAFLYAPRAYAPDGKVLPEHETFRPLNG